MSTATLVSVEEYLHTSYRPDCDYVDGLVEERNVGLHDHSVLMGEVIGWFSDRRKALRMRPFVAHRMRINDHRYRVPDVIVLKEPLPNDPVLLSPPYICIEILSPDDRLSKIQERFDDYLAIGVPNNWLLDPETRRAWYITADGSTVVKDGILRTTDGEVELPIAELYEGA